jgi:D-3-phosphoglycerate dehydrogenase
VAIVTIVGQVREEGLALLRARPDIELEILDEPDAAGLRVAVARSSAILVRTAAITEEVIAAAPHLRVVSRHGVGYDNVDVAALTARGIPLVVAASANMVSVAEHAVWMMLELAKHGRAIDAAMRQGDWRVRERLRPSEIAGKTLLIVGFGRIGSRVAARAQAFGMRILVHDPYVAAGQIEAAGGTSVGSLADCLAKADIVTLHCPLDSTTRHMIDV